MTEQIFDGDHYAVSYNGSGAGLVTIPRSALVAGTANAVIVNDGSGNLSSVGILNAARGGTGVDSSGYTGVAKVSGGAWSASAIVNADVSASAAIGRAKLASGSANYVLINNGSGVMTEEAQLAVSRGGTGQDFSGVGAGPFALTVSSGVVSAATGISTAATPSTIVLRDVSGNITGATFNASVVSTNSITSTGDLTIQPAGGDVLFGASVLHLTPNTIAGGDVTFRTGNCQTIGTATAAVVSVATASGIAYGVAVNIAAANVTNGSGAGQYTFIARAKNIAGVLTIGTILNKSSSRDSSIATASVTAAASGTTIEIRVTGSAGVTINWCCSATIVQQSF